MYDAERDLLHDSAAPDGSSLTLVANVPMQFIFSGTIAAQRTDDFCQTLFVTMKDEKSFSS